MDAFEIDYALSKQVPAMRNTVRLCSDYGELVLYGQAAKRVADAAERVLKDKRAALARKQASKQASKHRALD